MINNIKPNEINYKLTKGKIQKIKDQIFQRQDPTENISKKEEKTEARREFAKNFDKIEKLCEKKYTNKKEFINEIEKIFNNFNYTQKYEKIILEHASEKLNVRTNTDRFVTFALKYIDDFNLFSKIKFRVYSNTEVKEIEKHYHGKDFKFKKREHKTIYAKYNENKEKEYLYFIKNNNVFFEAQLKNGTQKGSISIHELRNLVFALSNKPPKAVEGKIISYLTEYKNILNSIKNEKTIEESKKILTQVKLKDFPNSIENYLNKKEVTIEDYKTSIIKRLEHINKYTENKKDGIKKIRKHEKVREIIKFVNRFNSAIRGENGKREYLDRDQHQELEKLLGTYPKSEQDLVYFLIDNEIRTEKSNFKDFIQNKPDINSILYKVFGIYISWSKKAITKIEKKNDIKYLKSVAKIINITPKDYSINNIKQNIDCFLMQNIVIPRGFVKRFFYNEGVSDLVKDLEPKTIIDFIYSKTEDLFENS